MLRFQSTFTYFEYIYKKAVTSLCLPDLISCYFFKVYTLDFYFRQRWMDERLATNATLENISVSINMLDMIWSPDTIFYNGRKSHLHVVPQPNRFIRIGKNGSIYFSQR